MTLRELFNSKPIEEPEPLFIGSGEGQLPPAPPMEKPVSDASAADVIAKSLCGFYREGPCPCKLDDKRICTAPQVFLKKATRIVWDLRTAGLLR